MRISKKDDQLWAYDEPIAGLDDRGEPITCNRQVVMTYRAILCHMRGVLQHKCTRAIPMISDDDMVEEFLTVHWAYPYPGKSKK